MARCIDTDGVVHAWKSGAYLYCDIGRWSSVIEVASSRTRHPVTCICCVAMGAPINDPKECQDG
jgi:hypothetical protein